jgi:hypothetical protein
MGGELMYIENYFEPSGRPEGRSDEADKKEKSPGITELIDNGDEEPREFASKREVVTALDEAFKSDAHLFKKLKNHALKWYSLLAAGKKVGENDAADVVTLVVRKLLTQTRKWYKAKTPNIVNVMLMAIVSEIRNGRKKLKPTIKKTSFYDKNGDLVEEKIEEIVRAYLREDISDGTITEQVENWISRLMQIFEKKDDTVAFCVLEELLDIDRTEIKKPEEYIAGKLGISVTDVKNAIRRIRRTINSVINNQ